MDPLAAMEGTLTYPTLPHHNLNLHYNNPSLTLTFPYRVISSIGFGYIVWEERALHVAWPFAEPSLTLAFTLP